MVDALGLRARMLTLSLLVAGVGGFAGGPAAAGDTGNASIARWAKGTIEYRMLATGEVIGAEHWHLTVHPDGSRTMQTANRMDLIDAQRHVTLRVAEDFRPLEVLAVYYTGGEWRGTGLFAVTGDTLRATVTSPQGMLVQEREVPERFSFIPHPLATDAWGTWTYDREQGGVQQRTVYDMDGGARSAGSMLGKLYTQPLEFLGSEEVSTPAGVFQADHFRAGANADIYLTGPDAILVRFVYATDSIKTEFVLTRLETGVD